MSVEETPASLFVVSNLSWPEKRVDTRDPEEPELARLSQYASVSVIAFATFPVFNRLAGCCLVGSDLEVVCDRRLLQSSLDCLPSFLFGLVCNVFALAACSSSMWSYCTRLRRLLQCRGRLPHHWLSRVSVCFRSRRSRLLVVLCAGAALVLFLNLSPIPLSLSLFSLACSCPLQHYLLPNLFRGDRPTRHATSRHSRRHFLPPPLLPTIRRLRLLFSASFGLALLAALRAFHSLRWHQLVAIHPSVCFGGLLASPHKFHVVFSMDTAASRE